MNPFEHQIHATKFDADKFAPRETEADLTTENIKSVQREISPKDSVRQKEKQGPVSKFDLENILRINGKTPTKEATPLEIEQQKINNLFQSGNLEDITEFLAEKKVANFVFQKEVLRVKKDYAEELSSADFLTAEDWQILTAIELFDKKTFIHSIGTYNVARKKIEERLTELGTEITHEGVELKQFYRGCLFHDIGKLAIPEFIINNTTTDAEWVYYFMEILPDDKNETDLFSKQDEILVENKIIIPDNIRHDLEKMTAFFSKNRIRAVKFVPIKAILTEQQTATLIKLGINPDDSLGKIMRTHEEKSEQILRSLGHVVEGLLAGNHHNYKHADKKMGEKPASLSAMHISTEIASNIIHLADIQQALSGDRSYHHKNPILRILAFLVDDAENGIIDPSIAARWIADELKKINPAYLNEIRNMKAKHQHHSYLQERNEELLIIDDFLVDHLPEEKVAEQLAA